MIEVGRDFTLKVDILEEELIIESRNGDGLIFRVPLSYVGGYAKVDDKADDPSKLKPELVDIMEKIKYTKGKP